MATKTDHHDTEIFTRRYNDLAPLFLDYPKAQESFRKIVSPSDRSLELGIGSGLFAKAHQSDGYSIDGIEVNPKMVINSCLPQGMPCDRLLQGYSDSKIEIISLVDYPFTEAYNIIYSHSGPLFLTKQDGQIYFEGYSSDREVNLQVLSRILNLISQTKGKFLLNLQENKIEVKLPDGSTFNLKNCTYDIDKQTAEKHFEFVEIDGSVREGGSGTYSRFACSLEQFKEYVNSFGEYNFEFVDDIWLVISYK